MRKLKVKRLQIPGDSSPLLIPKKKIEYVQGRTENQKKVLRAIANNDIVWVDGCPGTGKTLLSVGKMVELLDKGLISKITLTRPALEAGEKIGFQPGDADAKLSPYIRPLLKALRKFVDEDTIQEWRKEGKLEIAPMGFLRGDNLEGGIILDEGQNCTFDQLYLFLSRLEPNAKMVITFDEDQSDLPPHIPVVVGEIAEELAKYDGVALVELDESDIQRHRLVRAVIEVFNKLRSQRANS